MSQGAGAAATPLQVLLLEDRATDAELMVRELRKAGFEPDWQRVDTERDFRLRLVPNLDIILSDFNLPGFNALRALEILQATSLDVPLVIVSGSLGDEQAVECLRRGATDYLLKDRLARLGPSVRRAMDDRVNRRARATAEQELRRSEDQMRGILSTVEDIVFSLSLPEFRLQYLNPAAAKLFGRPTEEFMANPNLWLSCVHPEDRAGMAADQQLAIRWGTRESAFRIVRPDGSIRKAAARVWAAFGPHGEPVRLEGIVTDITDRERAEEERLELEVSRRETARLGQVNEFKTTFLNMVAHDLNNVLTPIKVSTHTLKAGGPGAVASNAKALAALDRGVDRLAAFLADILDTARLQSGELALAPQDLDLSSLLVAALDTAKAEAEPKGIRVEGDIPLGLHVRADARRIEQVTSNLLGNALKFTPDGGSVALAVKQTGGGVRIDVADSGLGIAAEDMVKLFQPFSQIGTAAQGKHTGTGLGLFICKGIVEAHGGTIQCESRGAGQGARFVVRLPVGGPEPGAP